MAELSDRQRLFVEGLLAGKSQAEAYRAAGYKVTTDASAWSNASALMRNHKVAAAIGEGRKSAQGAAGLTAEWVLTRLMGEAEDRGEGASQPGRIRALELLGRHLDLFVDRAEITTTTNVNVNLTHDQRREAILRVCGAVGG